MAVYEQNGKLSKTDQADIRAKEQAILGGPGTPTAKAAMIDQLYGSYGLETGSFHRPEFDQTGSGKASSSDLTSGFSIKWTILVFVGLFLFCKFCVWFQTHFPDEGDAFRAGVNIVFSFIGSGIGHFFGWLFN